MIQTAIGVQLSMRARKGIWPRGARINCDTLLLLRFAKAFGVEEAQVILGHATLDATQIYAEKNREAGIRIATDVG